MDKSPIPVGHFADIGHDQKIHYHAAGPADGEVVIFLHGARGGEHARRATRERCERVTVTWRGHGAISTQVAR